jgi:hypothetical protein
VSADLLSDGVTVTLVTAQPGGPEFLQSALLDRGVARLPETLTLVSDPDHNYLISEVSDIFVTVQQESYMNQKYMMVQPALVLIDKSTGKVVPELTWSWKTMEHGVDESSEVLPGVELVAYRPVISDLKAAIKERRPVRLASVKLSSAEIEEQCKQYGDWVD